MSNITPTPPSFYFGYWRPWKENAELFESYLDYAKDISLAKYSADIVGKYIDQASQEQISAIDDLGHKIGMGMSVLSNQMAGINNELTFLNKKLDLKIEQTKITHLLLENIGELLRVPDSEKERQRCIELGLKFFANAHQDDDLFADALENLKKAEALMRQDYFVLHLIGLIYMHSNKHINPQTALDYFTRAAKYASVESDPKAARLVSVMAKPANHASASVEADTVAIQSLAGNSYEKAAFSAYVLGNFELAAAHQVKAVKYDGSPENRFLLAKYQARAKQIDLCIQNLEGSIDEVPSMAVAVFKDLDLLNEPRVLKLIEEKNNVINEKIHQLIKDCEASDHDSVKKISIELNELLNATYDKKVKAFNEFNKIKSNAENEIKDLHIKTLNIKKKLAKDIEMLKKKLQNTFFLNLTDEKIKNLRQELDDCGDKPLETKNATYKKVSGLYEKERLKIGSKYAGGIVFYIDETGKHGLVAAEKDQGEAIWGLSGGELGTPFDFGAGKANTTIIVEKASKKGLFFKIPIPTAARICSELSLNGYDDWFLPSGSELNLMWKNLCQHGYGNFKPCKYWSSSESSLSQGDDLHFGTGESSSYLSAEKYYSFQVRAIRSF